MSIGTKGVVSVFACSCSVLRLSSLAYSIYGNTFYRLHFS